MPAVTLSTLGLNSGSSAGSSAPKHYGCPWSNELLQGKEDLTESRAAGIGQWGSLKKRLKVMPLVLIIFKSSTCVTDTKWQPVAAEILSNCCPHCAAEKCAADSRPQLNSATPCCQVAGTPARQATKFKPESVQEQILRLMSEAFCWSQSEIRECDPLYSQTCLRQPALRSTPDW